MATRRTMKRPQTRWRRSSVPVTGRVTRRSPRRGAIVLPGRRSRVCRVGGAVSLTVGDDPAADPASCPLRLNQDPGLGHMQSDIDAQLTNFFEDTPPRDFATVMRGYDRHQVDEHIRSIETEARTHRDQAQ